jgi:hypothetical protein
MIRRAWYTLYIQLFACSGYIISYARGLESDLSFMR